MGGYKQQLVEKCHAKLTGSFKHKTWQWWQLWLKIKPTLRSAKFAEIKAGLESKTHEAEKKIDIEKQGRLKAEAVHQKLSAEKAELEEVMTKGSSYIKDMEDKVRKVDNEKKEIDRQVNDVTKKLQEEEEATMSISNALRKLENEVKRSKEDVENMDFRLQQCEEDKQTKDSQIRSLKEELVSQEELVSK